MRLIRISRIFCAADDGVWSSLVLDSPEDPFLSGMTFEVRPRDKEVHRLNMMSGGEKSLTDTVVYFCDSALYAGSVLCV